jgi:hypothetical protein
MRLRRSRSDRLTVRFYYGSGSPYAWRVWLALEHRGIPYHLKTLSFDAGLSAVDLTVYPFLALFLRLAGRRADFVKDDVIGPRLAVRIDRMLSLPIVERTRPPHWK